MSTNSLAAVSDTDHRHIVLLHASAPGGSPGVVSEEQWLSATYRAASAGAWQWDVQTGAVNWSEEFCQVHGIQEICEEASFGAWLKLLRAEDRPGFHRVLHEAAHGNQAVDFDYRTAGEPMRRIHVRGRLVCSKEGDPLRVAGLAFESRKDDLARGVLETADSEQRRLQYALEEELSQQLTGILMKMQVLRDRLHREASPQSSYLERIVDLTTQAHTYTRDLARTLTPVTVRRGEFNEKLSQLASNTENLFGIACWSEVSERFTPRSHEEATRLYRIAEEVVHCVVKRASVRTVFIELRRERRTSVLRIATNADDVGQLFQGKGLTALRRCVSALGATLSTHRPSQGKAVLTCSFTQEGGREE